MSDNDLATKAEILREFDRLATEWVAEEQLLDFDHPWDKSDIRRAKRAFKEGYRLEALRRSLLIRRRRP